MILPYFSTAVLSSSWYETGGSVLLESKSLPLDRARFEGFILWEMQ
jgi:hypothetical protein